MARAAHSEPASGPLLSRVAIPGVRQGRDSFGERPTKKRGTTSDESPVAPTKTYGQSGQLADAVFAREDWVIRPVPAAVTVSL